MRAAAFQLMLKIPTKDLHAIHEARSTTVIIIIIMIIISIIMIIIIRSLKDEEVSETQPRPACCSSPVLAGRLFACATTTTIAYPATNERKGRGVICLSGCDCARARIAFRVLPHLLQVQAYLSVRKAEVVLK